LFQYIRKPFTRTTEMITLITGFGELVDNTVTIAYPEHKLHPKLQTKWVDDFIESKQEGVIVTQSDCIMLAFMVAVYQKRLLNTDIQIIFRNEEGEDVGVTMTELGRTPNPPKEFFDEIDNLVRKLI